MANKKTRELSELVRKYELSTISDDEKSGLYKMVEELGKSVELIIASMKKLGIKKGYDIKINFYHSYSEEMDKINFWIKIKDEKRTFVITGHYPQMIS